MVTHDRYFLDRVCNQIVEIDDRTLYSYKGNYSYYLEKREERIEIHNAEIDRARNLMRTELEWIQPPASGPGHQGQIPHRRLCRVAGESATREGSRSGAARSEIVVYRLQDFRGQGYHQELRRPEDYRGLRLHLHPLRKDGYRGQQRYRQVDLYQDAHRPGDSPTAAGSTSARQSSSAITARRACSLTTR